jgi:cytochrome c peroxidase
VVRRPDGHLVVADAFGGRLAGVDTGSGGVRVRRLDGVNLAALAVSGDGKELLVGYVAQYGTVPVTATNIDWGLVLSSHLAAVRLSEFDDASPGPRPPVPDVPRRRLTLDGSGHGAADPSALAVSPDGATVLVALSGAHQVLKNDRRLGSAEPDAAGLLPLGHNQRLETLEVGRSPVAVVFDPTGETAVTADAMSDTLTVLGVRDFRRRATIPLADGPPARTSAQRGEAAFLDGRLALDRWLSCASCHPGGHTNGLNFDTLGDGGYGAPKNTPSLLGVAPTAPFSWIGHFPTLDAQVRQSLRTSLRGPSPDDGTDADLVAYLSTLTPPPPPPARPPDDPAEVRGALVFTARGCVSCHRPPHYTTDGARSVGLDDGPGGHRAFNPPALQGISWGSPYLHDGSAETLGAALKSHPARRNPLTAREIDDLTAFLESL